MNSIVHITPQLPPAIDGVGVNGSAFTARTLGWLGTRLQNGRVGTYVVLFVVGVIAILSALTR